MNLIRLLGLLCLVTVILTGCDEEESVSTGAALLTTCEKNIPIYVWHEKLYYRETVSQNFRQVIATKEDVCTKFKSGVDRAS